MAKRIKSGHAALCFYGVSEAQRANQRKDIVRIRKKDGLPKHWIGTYEEAVDFLEHPADFDHHDGSSSGNEDAEDDDDDEEGGQAANSGNDQDSDEEETVTADGFHGVRSADLLIDPTSSGLLNFGDNLRSSTMPETAMAAILQQSLAQNQAVEALHPLNEQTRPTQTQTSTRSGRNQNPMKRVKTQSSKSQIHETITPTSAIEGFVAKGRVEYRMTDTAVHVIASEGIKIKSLKREDRVQIFLNGHKFSGQTGLQAARQISEGLNGRKRKHDDDEDNDTVTVNGNTSVA